MAREHGLELLGGRALAGAERVDERAGIAQPRGVGMAVHRDAPRFAADGRPLLARPRADAQPPPLGAAGHAGDLRRSGGFLFGGCGLGAAIEALEGTTERPVVWATAQYLSYATSPSILDIDVTIAVAGHQITQARAVGHVADREIFTVNAALGARPLRRRGPVGDDARRRRRPTTRRRAATRFDDGDDGDSMRPPRHAPGQGRDVGRPRRRRRATARRALWARLPELLDMSAAGARHPRRLRAVRHRPGARPLGGGNSLDNTLRVARLVPTEWVLVDIRVHAVRNGFGHGLVHLWAEDGTLLATASQCTIVRYWKRAATWRRPPSPAEQEEPADDASRCAGA